MANYLRTGDCNQCGECCGSVDAPNPTSPYPKNWPSALRTWSLSDVTDVCPQLGLFGLGQLGEDLVGVPPNNVVGFYRITGKPKYYVWLNNGNGPPMKDTSAAHDGSSYNTECPFLEPDPGDGSRPCALVGSNDEGARQRFCRPETHPTEYVPANDIWTQESVTQWQTDHPSCSYVFEEVIE